MTINPLVKEVLKSYKIDVDSGVLVLLGIYYGLDVDKVCPEEVVKGINLTKIVERDYKFNTVVWNIPLFEGIETNNSWNWVVDWVDGFGRINKERAGSWRDAVSRMQKFFQKYPEYRKGDVYAARNLYFRSVRDSQYLMKSHKFIFDGIGAMEKSTLLEWCEKVTAGASKKEGGEEWGMRGEVIK